MNRIVAGTALLALTVSGLVAFAQPAETKQPEGERREQPARGPEGGPRRGPNTGTPQNLEGAMKLMGGNLKRLKAQVADAAKKDENLKLVNEIQRGAVIAKGMDPTESFKRDPDAKGDALGAFPQAPDAKKKAAMAIEYRKKMIELVGKLLTLETQIMNDKTADAAKSVDEIIKFRNDNHEAFGVKD